MAFQSVPETAQVRILLEQSGVPMLTGFYVRKSGGYNLSDLQDLADAVDTYLETVMEDQINDLSSYNGVGVRGLENEFDYVADSVPAAPIFGGVINAQSASVAKAIKLGTGLTGKSARGRMYWGAFGVNQLQDAAHIKATTVDDIIDILDAIKAIVELLGWVWVVVSRFHNGTKRPEGITIPVTSFLASDLTLDSQRRRLD
jgi:hypothetical protein